MLDSMNVRNGWMRRNVDGFCRQHRNDVRLSVKINAFNIFRLDCDDHGNLTHKNTIGCVDVGEQSHTPDLSTARDVTSIALIFGRSG